MQSIATKALAIGRCQSEPRDPTMLTVAVVFGLQGLFARSLLAGLVEGLTPLS